MSLEDVVEEKSLKEIIFDLSYEYKPFDRKKTEEKLDEMIEEVKTNIEGKEYVYEIISEINKSFFEKRNFCFAEEDLLPHEVLEKEKGDCAMSSVLYLIVADELNLPITAAVIPNHMFVRWDDSKKKINIETTQNGVEISDASYEKAYNLKNSRPFPKILDRKGLISTFLDRLGIMHYSKGRLDEALDCYNRALSLDPKNEMVYNNRGLAYNRKGDFDEAFLDYCMAIGLDHDNSQAHSNRAGVYLKKGMVDKALQDMDRAVELDPGSASNYSNRGDVRSRKGMRKEALEDFNRAIELDPKGPFHYIRRGILYYSFSQLDEAESDCTTAIELNDKISLFHYTRALVYTEKGELDKAVSDLTSALELNPGDMNSYRKRGTIHYRRKDFDSALHDFTKIIGMEPNDVESRIRRGHIHYTKGMIDESIEDFEAIERLAKTSYISNCLGMLYYKKGDKEKAKKYF